MPGAMLDKESAVDALANRLRLIQVDFADDSQEARAGYLAEEVERALEGLAPDRRQAFLAELGRRFPSWEAVGEVSRHEPEHTPAAPMDARELQDPSFLVTKLMELAPTLSAQEKQVLVDRLRSAGYPLLQRTGGLDEESVSKLRAGLEMKPDAEVDQSRAVELIGLLAAFAGSLDQLVWRTWRQMAPRSAVRGSAALVSTARRFAEGNPEVPVGQVKHDMEHLRRLIASIIAAVGNVGRQFAAQHVARLAPSEISGLVKMEGGGLLTGHEVKCWRKYTELAASFDEPTIEKEIMEVITRYAESLMKGTSR